MSVRDQDIIERVTRAERDLLEFKNAQFFGKDVTSPKVLQRYNSDGTPTEWDVTGSYDSGLNRYTVGGKITYTAYNQDSPWVTIYAIIRINPSNEILSQYSVGFNAYYNYDNIFEGGKTMIFDVYGAASSVYGPPNDTTIDRYWLKLYVLASDAGHISFEFPAGDFGAGELVPLT